MTTHPELPSARVLLERFFACAVRGDGAGLGALFAPDGTLAFPFAGLSYAGAGAIGRRAQGAWDASPITLTAFVLTELIESETGLTAEYVVHGSVRATGGTFQIGSIAVLEAADGVIVAMREYLDPVALRASALEASSSARAFVASGARLDQRRRA